MKRIFKRLVLIAVLTLLPSASFAADPKIKTKQSTGPGGEITLRKAPDLTGSLTLQEVVAQVLLRNPELEAFSLEVRAREARALQAGLTKNPNLLLDVEDVFGTGGFGDVGQSQSTLLLSQVIELGGKRAKRERAALSHKDLAYWDYETARMNILTRVTQAYTGALTAQEKLKLARQLVTLSQNSYNAVKARVDAGKVSPIHEVKARVALSTTQIELQQAENLLTAAYRRLRNVHHYLQANNSSGDGENNLVIFDYDTPTPVHQDNWLGHFFYSLNASHVSHVIAKGRWIVKDRKVLTADEEAILAFAKTQAQRLWKKLVA